MDLVSIIIPVYNTGEPLRACLDSVINQTYTNLEIIVIDDHSTDPLTVEILQDFAQRDPRVKLHVCPENHGVYYCRNIGLSLVTGAYMALLDSDDRMVPEFVERMHQAITANQTDFVVCDYSNFKLDDTVQYVSEGDWPQAESDFEKTADFVRSTNFMHMPIAVFCKLINTERYKVINLLFDDSYRGAADQIWCYELFLRFSSFSVLKFKGVDRLLRANSLVRAPSEKWLIDNLRTLEARHALLKQYDLLQVHDAVFFDHCCATIVHTQERASSAEVRKKLLPLVDKIFKNMGYEINVYPSKIDLFWAGLEYKLAKVLKQQNHKIKAKARYKTYKTLRQYQ